MGDIETAVVLVGGQGLRLWPLTEEIPKCMLPIGDKPVIYWVLNWLKSNGIKKAVIGVAYKQEVVREYLRDNTFGLKIEISEHTIEAETGGGFKLAINRFVDDDDFVAMNGDVVTNMNLQGIMRSHLSHRPRPRATIAVSPLICPFGLVQLQDTFIVEFREKPTIPDRLVSSGIYIFNREIFHLLPDQGPIEQLSFPNLSSRGLIRAHRLTLTERWIPVDTIKDIAKAEEELRYWGLLKSKIQLSK